MGNYASLSAHLFLCLVMGLAAGCTLVPGIDLRPNIELQGAPSEIGGYEKFIINHNNYTKFNVFTPSINDVENVIRVSRSEIREGETQSEYTVGPGDVLSIIVWEHPELTNPTGEFRDAESAGRLVDSSGYIFYPYVGYLNVSGKTTRQIRSALEATLSRVVRDPQIDVRVVSFRSKQVFMLGEVTQPKALPITDRPLSLSDALAQSGGLTEKAVKNRVLVERNGENISVEMGSRNGALVAGEFLMMPGDRVTVPSIEDQKAYVFGAVSEQGAVPIPYGEESLSSVLSRAGSLSGVSSDRGEIYVIRKRRTSPELEIVESRQSSRSGHLLIGQLSLDSVNSLVLLNEVKIFPDDIIYVDRTGLATFNSVVSLLLPSISTVFQLDRLLLQAD